MITFSIRPTCPVAFQNTCMPSALITGGSMNGRIPSEYSSGERRIRYARRTYASGIAISTASAAELVGDRQAPHDRVRQPGSVHSSAYHASENPSGGKSMYRFSLIGPDGDDDERRHQEHDREAVTTIHLSARIRRASACATRSEPTIPTTTSDSAVRKIAIAAANGTFALNDAWSEMKTDSVQCSGRPRIAAMR